MTVLQLERHVGFQRLAGENASSRAKPREDSLRVLLNATPEELRGRGGDIKFYQNWLRLSDERLVFRMLPSSWRRRTQAFLRKACDKLARPWEPTGARRLLLLMARLLYLPRSVASQADLVLSHICFPFPHPRVPVIWSSQGIAPAAYYERRGQWPLEDVIFLYRVLGPRAQAVLIATESGAQTLLRWCPELEGKVHVVPVPVFVPSTIPEMKPSQRDGIIRLLFVGLDPVLKGLPELLRAYGELRRKYSSLRLDVVTRVLGRKTWRRFLGTDVPPEAWGIRIHPPLSHERIFELMREADLFVSPTHADTYGIAPVEAMAHRCAIVISNFDPMPELFPDAEVGFLIAPEDVRGLIERLEALITNLDLLRRFQENARQRYLAVHDPAKIRDQLARIFERVRDDAHRHRCR
ncbi:MAG: glycosyltransferase family 4 protein [Blastocatellia bacterium]|nr:glycosyltransferase family 4 protein [Blastocatellia bacterium]MCS7156505.1 glycosyltransferase family 4 protein [Blastocatellia bacterium]MCX7751754.1 glycosyltransferase family 4 protein [Blastocatellia bacterium]MDW8168855.1 glycosyltransferase family 4 protein [Acidobacteriota bacterium]MDW8256616.1 glycosyltransferase family 4 protein [Acidobacteriota bacterium]